MARESKALTRDALAAIVSAQINDADEYDGTDRDGVREWALRFFEGEVDIAPPGEGRSKVVSRDVADTHGVILPGLMRTFFGSDRVVIYEPTRKQHEAYASLATDYVNFVVMRECDGYRQFRSAIWDGLLIGNGVVKFWWDSTKTYDIEEFSELDDAEYALLTSQMGEDDEVLEHESYPADGSEADDEQDARAVEIDDDGTELVEDDADGVEAPESDEDGEQASDGPDMPGGAPMDAMAVLTGLLTAKPVEPPKPMLHDLKIRRLSQAGRLRLEAIPGEELLLDRNAKAISEDVRFIAHRYTATRSQLIEDGYDRDLVEAVPAHHDLDSVEDDIRDRYTDVSDAAPDTSTELVEVYECYVLVDADGDGVAERRRVVMAGAEGGRELLLDEAWSDDVPFADIVPDPRPHTWRGRGLYERVGDIQRIQTVGWRGVLDNLYDAISPVRDVEEGAYENMDAVYNPNFNEVLIRKPGRAPITPIAKEFIAPNVLPLLERVDQITEKRTGVSVRSQSQNADVLQNQTAQAAAIAQSAMHAKIDEYAQNIAQYGGMSRIFKCILKLFVRHQDRARKIRIAGQEVEIDPRAWEAGMDVVVNTGLGTGNRDRDVQALMVVANEQKGVIQQFGDPFNPMLNIGHLFDTLRKMAEAAGLRNADAYFPMLTQEQIRTLSEQRSQAQQGQPTPAMQEVQAKLQMQAAELQAKLQEGQIKLRADIEERQARLSAEITAMREKAAAEIALKQQESLSRIQIAEWEAMQKLGLKREEMQTEAVLTDRANAMNAASPPPPPRADTNIRGI